MNNTMQKILIIFAIITIFLITSVSTFFIVRYYSNKATIDTVIEVYSNDKVQDRLDTENSVIKNDLLLQVDGENVIGVIKIDKINFEGLVFEGTSLDTLEKGVGHFENSAYIDGNVCLAAHNTNKFWGKLHTMQNGDKITYISFLGTREYFVTNVTKIEETDWSLLENSNENLLTLITCVKGNPTQRLCVQALSVD